MKISATAVTPTGHGIWMVDAAGTVLATGDAYYHGSPAETPKDPVVAILATPTGRGYHLVTETGEVQSFGDARAPQAPPLTSS
jgi:hypothetical protein